MQKFEDIKNEILDEYMQPHSIPWVIGYSGGKDSTLLTHLVMDVLIDLAPSERNRDVWVVGNDTLVESPLVVDHLRQSIEAIDLASRAYNLPVKTQLTVPEAEKSFWVNLIGRGYPPPNRSFRWCTDRLKIRPTAGFVEKKISEIGRVILLIGVRRAESSNRARTIKKYDAEGRLSKHSDIQECLIFKPIVDLETDDVWEFLGSHKPLWNENHDKLIKLYRDSAGGECPVVMSRDDAPSCGTTSSRFGCWTCTVVKKDKSLDGFIEAGYANFQHLSSFRDWLLEIRDIPKNRMHRRRNGNVQFTKDGLLIRGPFTLSARKMILEKLLDTQLLYGETLITSEEIDIIYRVWTEDLELETQILTEMKSA